MRLGIFSSAFFLSEETSGVSNNVFLIARELDRKYKISIDVFSPYFFFTKNREELFGNDMRVHRFDNRSLLGGAHYAPAAMNVFRNFKFDIVHSHHYGYVSSEAGYHNSLKMGVPHILTPYYHPYQVNVLKKALMSIYNKTKGRKIIEGSKCITVQSDVEKQQILSMGKADIRKIPCALNETIFKYRKNKGNLVIGYVSLLSEVKGAHIALELFKELEKKYDDAEFIFVGPGPLEEFIKSNAPKNCKFYKYIPSKELASIFNRMTVMVAPTFYESFGRAIAEAMMCGVPVVTTDRGAVPETIGKGGVIVPYGNWKLMLEEIIRLIEDRKHRSMISTAARKKASEYETKKVAKLVYETYEASLSAD